MVEASPNNTEYFQVPYLARVLCREKKFDLSKVLQIETLGGREVQEDKCFACQSDDKQKQAYFMLDGFGGMAVVEFIKRNFKRVLKDSDWDPVRAVNRLDSELRVLALWSPQYRHNVMHYPQQRMDTIMGAYHEFVALASQQEQPDLTNLIEKHALSAQKDEIVAAITDYKGLSNEEKKYLYLPLFEAIGKKHRDQDQGEQLYEYEYRKKLARKVLLLQKAEQAGNNEKNAIISEYKNLNKRYAEDKDYAKAIDQETRPLIKASNPTIPNYLFNNPALFELKSGDSKEEQLFQRYKNLILLNDQESLTRHKKSPEGNAFKLRCELVDEICDKQRGLWYPEAKNIEEMYEPLIDKSSAPKFKKLYPQYSDLHAAFFTPFYRKQKRPIQEDIAHGWKLLKFAATMQHLISGLPTSNPMQQEDLTEEQLEKWREDAEKLNVFEGRDKDDSGDLGELREDLGQLLNAAQSALKHYVIRRVSDRVDRVPRFGDRTRVGAAIIVFFADLSQKPPYFSVSWRGDCHALVQDDKGVYQNLNQGHKSIGGLSLEVGRFLGATAQEHHYAANFSRDTQSIKVMLKDVKRAVLMTDGAFNQWEKDKQAPFPQSDNRDDWVKKLEDLVLESRFHEGGSDNSTMMFISMN